MQAYKSNQDKTSESRAIANQVRSGSESMDPMVQLKALQSKMYNQQKPSGNSTQTPTQMRLAALDLTSMRTRMITQVRNVFGNQSNPQPGSPTVADEYRQLQQRRKDNDLAIYCSDTVMTEWSTIHDASSNVLQPWRDIKKDLRELFRVADLEEILTAVWPTGTNDPIRTLTATNARDAILDNVNRKRKVSVSGPEKNVKEIAEKGDWKKMFEIMENSRSATRYGYNNDGKQGPHSIARCLGIEMRKKNTEMIMNQRGTAVARVKRIADMYEPYTRALSPKMACAVLYQWGNPGYAQFTKQQKNQLLDGAVKKYDAIRMHQQRLAKEKMKNDSHTTFKDFAHHLRPTKDFETFYRNLNNSAGGNIQQVPGQANDYSIQYLNAFEFFRGAFHYAADTSIDNQMLVRNSTIRNKDGNGDVDDLTRIKYLLLLGQFLSDLHPFASSFQDNAPADALAGGGEAASKQKVNTFLRPNAPAPISNEEFRQVMLGPSESAMMALRKEAVSIKPWIRNVRQNGVLPVVIPANGPTPLASQNGGMITWTNLKYISQNYIEKYQNQRLKLEPDPNLLATSTDLEVTKRNNWIQNLETAIPLIEQQIQTANERSNKGLVDESAANTLPPDLVDEYGEWQNEVLDTMIHPLLPKASVLTKRTKNRDRSGSFDENATAFAKEKKLKKMMLTRQGNNRNGNGAGGGFGRVTSGGF